MATKIWTGAVSGSFATSGNFTGGSPANGDTVFIGGSVSITAGLATGLSGIVLHVDPTYTGSIASSAAPLVIVVAAGSDFAATQGTHYLDLDTSNVDFTVHNAPGGSSSAAGLYLKGSSLNTVAISGGNVAIAGLDDEAATVDTLRVCGSTASVSIAAGRGTVVLTDARLLSGTLTIGCAATTLVVNSGTCTTMGTGVVATQTLYGGTLYSNSSGTTTALTIYGGVANFITSAVGRTVTTLTLNAGGSLVHDPGVLTITNKGNPSSPVKVTATAAF